MFKKYFVWQAHLLTTAREIRIQSQHWIISMISVNDLLCGQELTKSFISASAIHLPSISMLQTILLICIEIFIAWDKLLFFAFSIICWAAFCRANLSNAEATFRDFFALLSSLFRFWTWWNEAYPLAISLYTKDKHTHLCNKMKAYLCVFKSKQPHRPYIRTYVMEDTQILCYQARNRISLKIIMLVGRRFVGR